MVVVVEGFMANPVPVVTLVIEVAAVVVLHIVFWHRWMMRWWSWIIG